MSTLRLENLTVGYGKRKILEHVSFGAESGEIVAILGENGSGKTTLFRAIQGNIPVREGRILVENRDLSALTTRQRAALVTVMPQELPSAPGLTGFDLIEMAFYPLRGAFARLTTEDHARIDEAAHAFGADALLYRDLGKMSTGERQMISLLRAAVQDTPVLLLDEPSSAMDFNRTDRLFSFLHRLAEQGKTILIVLHDPTLALRHADVIVRMGNGTAEDVWHVREQDYAAMENSLRVLYPKLRIHRDPLFCYNKD